MMKNRHEFPQIYINFAKMILTKFYKAISVFRWDTAMEYHDSKLLSFLRELGTLFEFSCPYTSQQNGRAKRNHRHILNSVRAMLFSPYCPECACGEVSPLIIVHIINCFPSFVIHNVSFWAFLSYYTRLYVT
jgi:hypothetical protein